MNKPYYIIGRSIRIEMIKRCLTRHDLAIMTGLTPGTISNMLSGLQGGRFGITAIEKALGECFYSNHSEMEKYSSLQAVLGFDPRTATFRALRHSANGHGLPGRSFMNRAELIEALADYLLPQSAKNKTKCSNHRRKKTTCKKLLK